MFRDYTQRGFTFLETLFAVAIGALVIIALSLLLSRVVGVNRYDYEQILITENARLQMAHMTDAIRDAMSADEGWLVAADDNSLHLVMDSGGGVSQEITYQLAGTDLQQIITKPNTAPVMTVLSRDIRNEAAGKPIFKLFNINGQQLVPASATSNVVRKVTITLEIDVNPNQPPSGIEVTTTIIPRASLGAFNVVTELPATTIHYPSDYTANGTAQTFVYYTSGVTSQIVWPISLLNLSNLTTYGGYVVNINYQTASMGSNPPGWYAWVGPILVGQSGSQKYYTMDQVPVGSLCLGSDLTTMLANCAERTVSAGELTAHYQPIILYSTAGVQSYLQSLLFDWEGFATVTPPIEITQVNGLNPPYTFSCPNNRVANPVAVAGDGSSTTSGGNIQTYHVQVDWGDGSVTNGLGTFTPASGSGAFTYTFSAPAHTYAASGTYLIKARLYHGQPSGNDNEAEAVTSVSICF